MRIITESTFSKDSFEIRKSFHISSSKITCVRILCVQAVVDLLKRDDNVVIEALLDFRLFEAEWRM